MVPRIKNLFIILSLFCFSVGCVQVKHVVSDVKEAIVGEKEPPQRLLRRAKRDQAPPGPGEKSNPQKDPTSRRRSLRTQISSPDI